MNTRKRLLLASLQTGILALLIGSAMWGMGNFPLSKNILVAEVNSEASSNTMAQAKIVKLKELYFETLDGKAISLEQFTGRRVILNFWASWCPPCIKELPDLNTLAKRYQKDGLVLIAASQDKDLPTLQRFLAKQPLPHILIVRDTQKMFYTHQVQGLPSTILFNSKGQEVERIDGYQPWLSKPLLGKVEGLIH